MRAGRLRHRVTLCHRVLVVDDIGETRETYPPAEVIPAGIEPLRGREFWEAQKANAEVQGKVIVRYNPDITPTTRIQYDGRNLLILAIVHPEEKRREMHLLYKEMQ